jgi:hypothetical protein
LPARSQASLDERTLACQGVFVADVPGNRTLVGVGRSTHVKLFRLDGR